MDKLKIRDILHNTIYSAATYPHIGNNSILAANWILSDIGITDVDMIYKLAKIIDECAAYDHEISTDDLDTIVKLYSEILKWHTTKPRKLQLMSLYGTFDNVNLEQNSDEMFAIMSDIDDSYILTQC